MHVSEQQWDRLNPERWVHATMRAAERAQEKGRPSSDATPAQADAAREERDESQKGISEEQDEGEEDGDRKDALKRRDGGQKDTEQVDDAEDDAGLFLEERGDPRPLNTAKGSGAQDVAEERPAATTGTHGARGDAERERPRLHAVDESGRGGSGGRHGQNVTENAAEHSLTRHLLDSKPESKLSTKLTNVPVGWERVGDAKGKDSEKAVVGKTTLSPGQLSKTGAWLTQKGSQQRHTIHGEYQGTWQAEDEGKKGRRQKRGTYTAGSMEVPTGWWRRSKAQAGTGTAEVTSRMVKH